VGKFEAADRAQERYGDKERVSKCTTEAHTRREPHHNGLVGIKHLHEEAAAIDDGNQRHGLITHLTRAPGRVREGEEPRRVPRLHVDHRRNAYSGGPRKAKRCAQVR